MDPFLGTWTITDWKRGLEVSGEIPANGFKLGGPLDITGSDPNGSSIDLFWHNDDDQDCSASGLQYEEAFNHLEGQSITASFAGQSVLCDFTVDLDPTDPTTLKLTINFVGGTPPSSSDTEVRTRVHPTVHPEVGSGVVTATATPP